MKYRIFRSEQSRSLFDIWLVDDEENKISPTKHMNLYFDEVSTIFEEFYT